MKFIKKTPWLIWMVALPVFGQSLTELERKAAGGDVGSMLRVAMRYYEGEGIGKNALQAYRWFRMAAEKGDTEGMFALGLMHSRGIGAQQSSNEAARWTLKAAELGHAHSQ
jgi:TPR repeat protein